MPNLLYDLPQDLQEVIVTQATKMNKQIMLQNLPVKNRTEEALYTTVAIKKRNEIELYHFVEDWVQTYNDVEFILPNIFVHTRNINIGFSWYDLLVV